MSRFGIVAGGTCGSFPSPHCGRASRLTTAYCVFRDDLGIIVDNGYGIVNVIEYMRLMKGVKAIIILQTHLHSDHVEGLPHNAFLFQADIPVLGIYSPECCNDRIDVVWERVFAKSNWPVRPEDFGIKHTLLTLTGGGFVPIPGYDMFLSTCVLSHPGGSLAYRISHRKGDIVIATDHEPGLEPLVDRRYAEFVSGARLLVADVQYRLSEYQGVAGINGNPAVSRKGWGHGTPETLLACLKDCREMPKQLWITHHDSNRSGSDLARLDEDLFAASQGVIPGRAIFAADGKCLFF